ncbi:uncharacterized protein GLRG_02844 [Colletotrichum graminicola M1.001]|uniref:Uncharacterized protein n=1 Tax=Colletotrichum graminicola (strain M1.001 / M2 / FGSC 10212) TaxID=645133 RepID=E3QA12_COLGM|nr:uncharacterized protein GLRG_02844 [Colletotrichum graminicola M1.001]EFQ27700.1 hypothetical protein GLRG_02844 [Colletotrichum graminicola M1.001]
MSKLPRGFGAVADKSADEKADGADTVTASLARLRSASACIVSRWAITSSNSANPAEPALEGLRKPWEEGMHYRS